MCFGIDGNKPCRYPRLPALERELLQKYDTTGRAKGRRSPSSRRKRFQVRILIMESFEESGGRLLPKLASFIHYNGLPISNVITDDNPFRLFLRFGKFFSSQTQHADSVILSF